MCPGGNREAVRRAAATARGDSRAQRRIAQQTRREAGDLVIRAQHLVDQSLRLVLEGALDVASVPAVLEEITVSQESAASIAVDLAGVEFIDSAGLHLLLRITQSQANDQGGVELMRPSPAVRRLVELTRTTARLGLDEETQRPATGA